MYKQKNNILYIVHIHTIITMDFICFISVVSTWMELQSGALREDQREDKHTSQLDKAGIHSHMLSCMNLF